MDHDEKRAGLESEILRLNAIYYNTGDSPIPDEDYDQLKRALRQVAPDSPILTQVGAPVDKNTLLTRAAHKIHMGSIQNAMDLDEFKKWWTKVGDPSVVLSSLKVDGLSIDLEYENGRLIRAITRGDGVEGEDVTFNIMHARDMPIMTNPQPAFNSSGSATATHAFTGSVRAEVLLYNEDWREADPEAKNPRNAASGLLRRKSDQSKAKYLRVLAHDVAWPGMVFSTWWQKFTILQTLGFKVPTHWPANSIEFVTKIFQEVEANRANYPYEIDGLIVAVGDMNAFTQLGIDGESCPRGQIAMKFTSMKAQTALKGVEWSVGHTGALNPVGILHPVQLAGVTVSNVTLCNMNEIGRLGVMIGDVVEISRQGDVIPKLLRVVNHSPQGVPINQPATCPACNGTVGRKKVGNNEDSAHIYCLNSDCDAQALGKIRRWIKSLDIKGIGDEVIQALVDSEMVKTPADLYRLSFGKLVDMKIGDKVYGAKRSESIMKEIAKKKKLTIDQFLGSLGVVHLGKRRVEIIRKAWAAQKGQSVAKPDYLNTLDGWFSESTAPYVQTSFLINHAAELGIPGIALAIQKGLDDIEDVVADLLGAGVEIIAPEPEITASADAKLAGKSFCFTGVRATDEEIAKMKSLGAEEKSGVSKGLTYLVAKDKNSTSSKAVKAKEIGAEVIDYEQFKTLLND